MVNDKDQRDHRKTSRYDVQGIIPGFMDVITRCKIETEIKTEEQIKEQDQSMYRTEFDLCDTVFQDRFFISGDKDVLNKKKPHINFHGEKDRVEQKIEQG